MKKLMLTIAGLLVFAFMGTAAAQSNEQGDRGNAIAPPEIETIPPETPPGAEISAVHRENKKNDHNENPAPPPGPGE